jgi:SRSO17 transposase
VAETPWTDAAVLKAVREYALAAIEERGPIQASIVDDTGIPRKGQHSVGVARQYCGQLGKPDNCRVAVTLALANDAASLPIAYQLYLPEPWASDRAQRQSRGVRGDQVSHQARDRPSADHGGGRTGRARGGSAGRRRLW